MQSLREIVINAVILKYVRKQKNGWLNKIGLFTLKKRNMIVFYKIKSRKGCSLTFFNIEKFTNTKWSYGMLGSKEDGVHLPHN